MKGSLLTLATAEAHCHRMLVGVDARTEISSKVLSDSNVRILALILYASRE